ncbi:uncharacterized protein LOC118544094 isoform X4 [Halichoerus grypus]|uniref:translation initiation factor IF-2-like isoform X2 n=1 Tax=Halichoerus grypus TaxID=9711 RepID=UPI001659F058|nr:translation initiation factor IF-2-like isoform X2 [Halichoerus grypus]
MPTPGPLLRSERWGPRQHPKEREAARSWEPTEQRPRTHQRIDSQAGSDWVAGASRGQEAPRHAIHSRLAPAARCPPAVSFPAPCTARPPPPGPGPALPGLLGPGPAAGLLGAGGEPELPERADLRRGRRRGAGAAAPGRPAPGAARPAALAAPAALAPPLLLPAPSAALGAPRALAPPSRARALLWLPQRQPVPAPRRAGALQQPAAQPAAGRGYRRRAARRPAALGLWGCGLQSARAGDARRGADSRRAGRSGLRVPAGGVRPARGAPPRQPPRAQSGPGAVRRGLLWPAARAAPQAARQRAAAGLTLSAAARSLPILPPRTSRGCAGLQGTAFRTEDGPLRCKQLTLLLDWMEQFEAESRQSGEAVAFSVLLGDLNFDNCSSDHAKEQEHELFSHFWDPCRLGTRREQPWALGTMLNTSTLHHSVACSPEMLRRALEQEEGRHRYLAGPPGRGPRAKPWRGRRVDYIMYQGAAGGPLSPEVEQVTFSTALAGLTDHLAVGLRLRVSAPS